jgi:integrase
VSVHQRKDGRYYVSYRDETGKQRVEYFGRGKDALKRAESYDLQLKAERKLGVRPQAKSKVYLDDLARAYIKDREANSASINYLTCLRGLLNNHILPILGTKPVDELAYDDMLNIAELYKDKSQATRNRYFTYLKAIFRWGLKHEITKNNPLKNWVKKKEQPWRFQLTVDDLKKILTKAAPHLKWAIEVEWNLGTRPGASELLSLKWEHIDFERNIVSVFATKTKDWREIPISEEFKKHLIEMRDVAKTEYVIEYQGRKLGKIKTAFRTACRKAGITYPCRMYDIRHLFASVMLSGGADLAAVSKLLGHSNIIMTANVYYELMKGEKERAVGILPSILGEGDDKNKC